MSFLVTLSDPNLDFKVTVLFDGEYLENGAIASFGRTLVFACKTNGSTLKKIPPRMHQNPPS